MAVLVTGGAGLLGSELVRLLLDNGVERPVVMDIAESAARLADVCDSIDYIQGDVGDPQALESVIDSVRPSAIYHLGAMLGISCEENPVAATQVNVMGFIHLLEAARRFDVSQVIFASSVTTFGEDLDEGGMRDDAVQRPATFYGVTKLFGESAGRYYRRKYGLDFRAIRFPSLIGPGTRAGGILNYTSEIIEESIKGNSYTVIGAPDTRISFLHVRDAATALVKVAAAPREKIQSTCYLVDGTLPTPSALDMAKMVQTRIPSAQIDFEPNEQWKPLFDQLAVPIDDSPARREWGWQPTYDYGRIIDDFVQRLQDSHAA